MRLLPLLFLGLLASVALNVVPADAAKRKKVARVEEGNRVHWMPPRVICGVTGCHEIPKGCRGEVRPSGFSVVAIVIC